MVLKYRLTFESYSKPQSLEFRAVNDFDARDKASAILDKWEKPQDIELLCLGEVDTGFVYVP